MVFISVSTLKAYSVLVLVLAGGPEAPPLCVLQIVVLVGISAGVRHFGRGCDGGSARVVLVACPL